MMLILFTALLVFSASMVAAGGDVFAHFIIGNAAYMGAQDWAHQVHLAKSAHIDGFALNIAKDTYTDAQLALAYDAASSCPLGDFHVFISFDYEAAKAQGGFSAQEVEDLINKYKGHPGQYKHGGQQGAPLVSTFEGTENKGDLVGIKGATGAFMVPDYSSLGPEAAAAVPGVDGLLSWDAWPEGTANLPVSGPAYKTALGSRPFMMPISPWFYTNLESKQWLWRSDSLWHLSWQNAVKLQPAMIEILTWNDWGESSYIGPNPRVASSLPPGSEAYVTPTSHSAWLADLPFYIQQYKQAGAPKAGSYKPHITFWHRLSPVASCPTCECNAEYQSEHPAGAQCAEDAIFVTAFPECDKIAKGSVTIGGVTKTFEAKMPGVFHTSFPFSAFGGRLGPVKVEGAGMGHARGKAIENTCVAGWNAYVGTTA